MAPPHADGFRAFLRHLTMLHELYFRSFRTRFGLFRIWASSRGLYALEFGEAQRLYEEAKKLPPSVSSLLKRTEASLKRYLSGERTGFKGLPIDWSDYSAFECAVLQELQKIKRGSQASYQFLARRTGKPRAVRFIGKILGKNRLPILIPCHRIVRKDGGLGGFSKGLGWKKRLLKLERADVDTKSRVKAGRLTGPSGVL